MTTKEAWERIKNTLAVGLKGEIIFEEIKFKFDEKSLEKDIQIIDKALEKFTTQQIIPRAIFVGECPSCNTIVYLDQKYCDGCGQKLEYKDE